LQRWRLRDGAAAGGDDALGASEGAPDAFLSWKTAKNREGREGHGRGTPRMNANERAWSLVLCAVCALPLAATRAQTGWTHFGRGPQRDSSATLAPPALDAPVVISADETGAPIEWVWQSGVVVGLDHALAQGWSRGEPRVFAVGLSGGAASATVAWSSVVDEPVFNSWSTTLVDASNTAVVVASGEELTAIDIFTGSRRWTAPLQNPIVNASPLITDDLGGADRVFITDASAFGDGRLYCVNADPRSTGNPFDPGEIVWSVVLGDTNGNTPAYLAGVVYVSTAGGKVLAFDATATSAPEPLWTFENPSAGFFSGCAVRSDGAGVSIFAATYAFSGGHLNSHLIELDAMTGAEQWRAASNRTDATPIPLDGGRVVLSGGLSGFGSQPSLQLFRETPGGAELVWDTALDTWEDLNGNQRLDPGEFLPAGGWTHQPIVTGDMILCGAIPVSGSSFGPCTDLYMLDLSLAPSDPGFVGDRFEGAGATPALTDAGLITIGASGLHIFSVCYADCDNSSGAGDLDVFDFLCFQDRFIAGDPYACDCDVSGGGGVCDVFDFLCFQDRFIAGCD
jgi:hypothetical protein